MKNIDKESPLVVAKAYYKSWTNKNYDEAAKYLDESVKFEMPINSYESKKEFMNAVRFTGNATTSINLLAEIGNETDAVLLYDFTLEAIGNIRIAEHFKVVNGKIVLLRHIHDTYLIRNYVYDNNNS